MRFSAKPVSRLPLYLAAFVGAFCVAGVLFVGHSMAAEETAPAADMPDRQAVEKIVRDYLLREPEILLEALDALEQKQAAATHADAEATIAANAEAIYNDPNSFVAGNPDGDVTIVEFFDYQCGFCKRSLDTVMSVLEDDGNIRLVLKEFPILGDTSTYATRAAMAAMPQGKYMDLHRALLRTKGKLTQERVLRIAEDEGLDIARLKKDMKDARITETIEANYDIARRIGVEGTPAFIVGGMFAPGAIGKEEMTDLVAQARASAS